MQSVVTDCILEEDKTYNAHTRPNGYLSLLSVKNLESKKKKNT